MEDEITWRRKWKPDFESQPWQSIIVSAATYLIKYFFQEVICTYEIAITDCEHVWFETINQTQFADRAKKLNPNVEAQNLYLFNNLLNSLNCDHTSTDNDFTMKRHDDEIMVIQLKTKLPAGIPFLWEFHLSCDDNKLMRNHLVLPLLSMVGELQRRQMELIKILKKKDYEIQEYKNSGAVLSRRSFETTPFDEDSFTKKTTVSEKFIENVKYPVAISCNKENRDLYKQVMIKQKWLASRNKPASNSIIDEASVLEDDILPSTGINPVPPSLSSWDTRIPPSLIGDMTTSPVKHSANSSRDSPVEASPPTKSATKDNELERRENLRKKLENEGEKKRQRKKIKLKV